MLLLAAACSDQFLTPLPPAEEADTGPDASDSAPPVDSAPAETGGDTGDSSPCGARSLGVADGSPLVRGTESDAGNVVYFGIAITRGIEEGAPRVWVQAALGGTDSTEPGAEDNGAYLLDAEAWTEAVLPSTEGPRLYSDARTWEPQPWLHRGGLTTDPAYPGEATWFADDEDDGSGAVLMLFAHPPSAPSAMADVADASLSLRYPQPHSSLTHDLDGDGLDDLLVPGWPIHVFIAPLSGALTEADADRVFEMATTDTFGWGVGAGQAAEDLDGDGYADLVWTASPRRWEGEEADDVFFVRGPIVTREDWSGPDGVLLDDVPRDERTGSSLSGEGGGVRAAGDVTGDGRADLTVYSPNEAFGEPGSSVLYVIDHLVVGTEELGEQSLRLVGLPPSNGQPGRLVSGGWGDATGDGLDDLVLFEHSAGLSTGIEYRSYLVPGPITGQVDLATEAVNIRLPAPSDSAHNQAILVPDLDADGLEDIVVSTIGYDGAPGVVWLFSGCEAW